MEDGVAITQSFLGLVGDDAWFIGRWRVDSISHYRCRVTLNAGLATGCEFVPLRGLLLPLSAHACAVEPPVTGHRSVSVRQPLR